jgi:phage-related protein
MADITLSLTGANGDTITLGQDDFILENAVAGLGRPPIVSRIDQSSADGGVFRFSRRGVREIDLPVTVIASDRATLESKLRRLQRILDNSTGTGTTIRASYATGESWSVVGHYVSGATSQTGDNGTSTFQRWVLVFQCPQPFWVRDQAITYVASATGTGRGLFNPNDMVNMKVAPSQVLGAISVANPGDVAAPPKFVITGPCDSASFTLGSLGFTYNAAVTAGTVITIDTVAGTVVDGSGTNLYSNLSSAPKFFQVPAGTSTINMSAVNSTSATSLQITFQPRKEVVQ